MHANFALLELQHALRDPDLPPRAAITAAVWLTVDRCPSVLAGRDVQPPPAQIRSSKSMHLCVHVIVTIKPRNATRSTWQRTQRLAMKIAGSFC